MFNDDARTMRACMHKGSELSEFLTRPRWRLRRRDRAVATPVQTIRSHEVHISVVLAGLRRASEFALLSNKGL